MNAIMNKKLAEVQKALKAPKSQFNKFGGYSYRSCEDILEAAKPLCIEHGLLLKITDQVVNVGERYYVEATAAVYDTEKDCEPITATGYARESDVKKGMDESQITGAASSYARKYALNGLFCIDDTKDADATNDHNGGKGKAAEELAKKAESAGMGSVQKYCCTDCGKEFGAYKDKSGKQWTAAQVFKMSQANNADGKARCSDCMAKAGTQKKGKK